MKRRERPGYARGPGALTGAAGVNVALPVRGRGPDARPAGVGRCRAGAYLLPGRGPEAAWTGAGRGGGCGEGMACMGLLGCAGPERSTCRLTGCAPSDTASERLVRGAVHVMAWFGATGAPKPAGWGLRDDAEQAMKYSLEIHMA